MGKRIPIRGEEFGLRLQSLRMERHLTQPELAAQTAGVVSRSWIARAESGAMAKVDSLYAKRLAQVLDVAEEYLLRGENYLSHTGGDLTFIIPIDILLTREEEDVVRGIVDRLVREIVRLIRARG